MNDIKFLTIAELEKGLEYIRQSPKDHGFLEMLVRRPQTDEREEIESGQLDPSEGLVGDNWKSKGSSRTVDGSAHPEMQIDIMNSRVISLLAQGRERWKLAGDQLFIDLDLSAENLPAGTMLAIGDAVLEITPIPHAGCKKFAARFGQDAIVFVNSPLGKELHLRGLNAKVIKPGVIGRGDIVSKL